MSAWRKRFARSALFAGAAILGGLPWHLDTLAILQKGSDSE